MYRKKVAAKKYGKKVTGKKRNDTAFCNILSPVYDVQTFDNV